MFPLASIFTDIPEAIVLFFHDTMGLGWGPSIIALTFTVRLAIVPLSIKQIRSMRALQALSPQLKAIQERYKDDRQRQQQ
jgi:YidC/Oxa1 family membrane protein insertase